MKNNLVSQSNDLVTASYMMTVKEKEILLACISQIDSRPGAPEVTKKTKYVVSINQMKDLFFDETSEDNAFRDLRKASRRLFDREVTIKLENDKTLLTRFVSGILFDPSEHQITITFAEDILPYLTQLSANFTKYRLHEVAELSSSYAMRLYELIVMWINKRNYSKSLDLYEFREMLGVENKYKQFGQLRENVIEIAINEINEKTNYKVNVSYEKKGRSYAIIHLSFYKKTLDQIAEDGKLSKEKIKAIVDNVQFMNDYNNHASLSYQAKMDTEVFKREMMHIIQREPETFNKKGKTLDTYLPKIKY